MPQTMIICDGAYTPVLSVNDYAPGEHEHSCIRNDIPAREWVTARGSRWSGVKPDGTAYVTPVTV